MNLQKNISRENIAESIHREFGFPRKECLDVVNDIIDIIISGLQSQGFVKIHNFGTFKLKQKKSRLGRNPKTKEEFIIPKRQKLTLKASSAIKSKLN